MILQVKRWEYRPRILLVPACLMFLLSVKVFRLGTLLEAYGSLNLYLNIIALCSLKPSIFSVNRGAK